jgi:hypothetical protein
MGTKRVGRRGKGDGKGTAQQITVGHVSDALGCITEWVKFVRQAVDGLDANLPCSMATGYETPIYASDISTTKKCYIQVIQVGCPVPIKGSKPTGGGKSPRLRRKKTQ